VGFVEALASEAEASRADTIETFKDEMLDFGRYTEYRYWLFRR
jgi:hypothetical protein